MIELIQFPWSPFCIVQRRILEYTGARFKITNIPPTDRTLVWRLSRERYYAVPIIKDDSTVIFETGETSQVIAKYLSDKLDLGLFPPEWRGIQSILWRFIENDVEGLTFRLNDAYWEEFVPARERLDYQRFKERKFGRGCLDQWRRQQSDLKAQLCEALVHFEQRLLYTPFLLGETPVFVDFDLFGMLGNFLYSGHYQLPAPHTQIRSWYKRMSSIQSSSVREKLHSRHERPPARSKLAP